MMITLTIILAEITLVLLAVVAVISVRALKKRRRDRDAVKTLVISIKANQPSRVEKLAGMLKDSNHLSDDDALNKADELIKKQNKFYQEAIDLYFSRNNEVLSKLDNRLEDLLDQYQGLLKVTTADNSGVNPEAMEQLSKDIAALSKELEELRTENAALSTQLKAAEQELDQLGREYVSAFNKPKVDKAKAAGSESSETVEDDQTEATADEQIEVEGVAPTMGDAPIDETPDIVAVTDDDEPAVAAPTPNEAPVLKEVASPPGGKEEAGKRSEAALVEDGDEENLFADLGLDELIGEQPGRRAVGGNSVDKK